MRRSLIGVMASVFAVVLAGVLVQADEAKEEKVSLDKVPRAVLKAVKAKFKDAKLVGAEKENDGGKVVYEIALKVKEQAIDVSVTAEGKIVSIEKTIAAKDLPKAVADTIGRKYPRATLRKIEEITEDDKTTYEVLLTTTGKKTIEVVLDPAGKVVKEEKKDEKDSESDKKD